VLHFGFAVGGSGEAFRLLEQLARENPDDPTVQQVYGLSLQRLERFDEAFAILERIAKSGKSPRLDESTLRFVVNGLAHRGRIGDALRLVGSRLKQETDLGERALALRIAADMFSEVDDTRDPVIRVCLLEYALDVLPKDDEPRTSLAWEYSQNDAAAPALFHYERALRGKPELAFAQNNAGVAAKQLGFLGLSISHFRKAEALGNTLAMANLGNRLLDEGFLEEADALIAKARAQEDVHPNIEHLAVRTIELREAETEKHARAQKDFEKLTELRVQFARALLAEPLARTKISGSYVGEPSTVDVSVESEGSIAGVFSRVPGRTTTFRGVLRGRSATIVWEDTPPPDGTLLKSIGTSLLTAGIAPLPKSGHGLLVFSGDKIGGYTALGENRLDATSLEEVVIWRARRASN
jgi:tetratricopeptide (TPR) repeat protein